jgi:hypothetical protein
MSKSHHVAALWSIAKLAEWTLSEDEVVHAGRESFGAGSAKVEPEASVAMSPTVFAGASVGLTNDTVHTFSWSSGRFFVGHSDGKRRLSAGWVS